ncbi:MAG: DinB family protein [Balneolaceae bacterium]
MNSSTLSGTLNLFRYYKQLTEKAITQLSDDQLHKDPGADLNNIAVLMKHLSGNMKSRWTHFRTEDGEKPWRNRDTEFVDDFRSRTELMNFWEEGWKVLFEALHSVKEEELDNIIYIRNEGATVRAGIDRQLAHIAYHVGQIVLIARLFTGEKWESLSIPKGKTEEYNREKFGSEKKMGFYKDRLK